MNRNAKTNVFRPALPHFPKIRYCDLLIAPYAVLIAPKEIGK